LEIQNLFTTFAVELKPIKTNRVMKDYVNKQFSVNGIEVICRGDYEGLPCPMCALEFSDDEMQRIANFIYDAMLNDYDFSESVIALYFKNPMELENENYELCEDMDLAFWREMEEIAVSEGMRYYEDMTNDEYKAIIKKYK
jgi:hypothetical protein